jgi:Rieske Fe-S protein
MTEENTTPRSRRAFFGDVLRIGAGAVVTGALLPQLARAMKDEKVVATIKLAERKELADVGGFVLLKDTPGGDILIVRTGKETYQALSPICPHKECTVKVKSADLIQCPCHKSAYALDGTYQSGPSKKSLAKFPFTIKDGTLSVLSE